MGLLKGNRGTALHEFLTDWERQDVVPSAHLAEEVLGTKSCRLWGIVPMSHVTGGSPPEEGGSSGPGVFVGLVRSHGKAKGIPWFLVFPVSTCLYWKLVRRIALHGLSTAHSKHLEVSK